MFPPDLGLQKALTHAVEKELYAEVLAAVTADGTRTLAHFRSTNGAWKSTPRLRHLQLTNAASRTRMERDLNLDLTVLDGVTVSADFQDVDMKGDFLLGSFQDGDGNEYEDWHDSLRDRNAKFAAAAVCSYKVEPPNCVVGSERKPADLWVGPTSHGFALAGTREFWGDFNIVGATLATYRDAAARACGAAARKGVENKMSDALPFIPEDAFFQPLVFEADGHVDKPLITLLTGWSKRYGGNSGLGDTEAKRLLKNWMGELAIVHARGLARCLNSRAARCVYETAVRNGKVRGHKLPPSQREIDEFYPPGDCWMGTSSSHRAD